MDQQALIPVFISYSQYDRKWRDRIASAFKKFEVLDDTLISSSGKDWRDSREELERMWQRARVAILIVTPSFLKDDRMQFEVLQLLALNASDRLRVLSVIGEPWSQQDLTSINFRQIFNGQTFPPGGRSLSQGNEYQIEKDLELLAWEVERLAREVTPASPVESPTATQPQPGLAQQLALSLKIAHPDGFYAAMASLVSPAKAVAPYHVFTESGLQKNGKLNITVEFLGSSPRHTTKATVLAADDVENIVLFQLESGGPFDWPVVFLRTSPVDPAGNWQSYFKNPNLSDGIDIEGTFLRSMTSGGHSYQVLMPATPVSHPAGMSGAPIVWNGQLVGIMSGVAGDGSIWEAIPILQPAINKLSTASSETKAPSRWLDKATIDRFSREVHVALQRADQIRTEYKLKRIYPPALLLAFAEQHDGELYALLAKIGTNLRSLIGKADFAPGKEEEPPSELQGFPPIGPETRSALIMARDKANESGPETMIKEGHVLYGLLFATDYRVVRTLNERGITPDKITLPTPSSDTKKQTQWFDKATIDRFSAEVHAALQRADQIRTQNKLKWIHLPDLLLAFAERAGGQLSKLLARAKVRLDPLVGAERDVETPEELPPSEPSGFPRISPNVRKALNIARDKANESGPETPIEEGHVLYGIFSVTSHKVIQALNGHDITLDKIRLPERFSLAGYKSDDPTGEDLLDIDKEAEALATLLAAKDVDPPLSLGLFGEWGSGKSFFMRRLEFHIDRFQEDAKLAKGASAFCQEIIQLTFNAWSYIDTNLWASLAAEIFEGLATEIAIKHKEDKKVERELVRAAASNAETVLAEAEMEKRKAEEELRQTKQELAALQQGQRNIEFEPSQAELIQQAFHFAIQQEDVKQQINKAAEELHIKEGIEAADKIKTEILSLRGTLSTLYFTLRNNKTWFMILGAVLILIASALALLKYYNIQELATYVGTVLTGIAGFLLSFRIWADKALEFIKKAQESKKDIIENKKKQRIEELQTKFKTIETRINQLNQQLPNMRAGRQLVDYVRQRYESSDYTKHLGIIAQARVDFRRLSTLLQNVHDEAEGEPERQDTKGGENTKSSKPLFPRIDRIILYIDDLDRCPEKNVFEVLQAVHLLLAFPLFVVVVGVDPRWLLHSLEQHSAIFKAEARDGNGESNGAIAEDDVHWRSTPMNYLEKIFQIPFALRPIDRTGFGNLVDQFVPPDKDEFVSVGSGASVSGTEVKISASTFTRPAAPESVAASSQAPITPTHPSAAGEQPPSSSVLVGQQSPPPSESDKKDKTAAAGQQVKTGPLETDRVVNRNPEHLKIKRYERDFMKRLHEFIPSPRAGKRFINIYRLLRASVKDSERAAFAGDAKGGEYQSALMLLAIMTGYPEEAAEMLRILVEEKPGGTWGEFIASCKARFCGNDPVTPSRGKQSQRKANGKAAEAPRPESERWHELFESLDKVGQNHAKENAAEQKLSERSCDGFEKWASRVARYSFQSGRALLYVRE